MRRLFQTTVGCLMFGCVVAPAAPPSAAWTKSFFDEFAGASIDGSKWSYGSLPWGGQHHNDQYASWITSADSYLTNGSLMLRCRAAVSNEFGGYPWSEGFVHSNGKMNYTYGYVEIRARYPLGKGVWPAFWMLPSGWPPEFDIAEYFGSDGRMHMGLATGTSGSPVWNSSSFYQSNGETFQNWHTYALEWGPGYAIWYKDNAVKKSIYDSSVPAVPMYVILNSGMRWDYDGTTPNPNYFEVDYFRKYNSPAVAINDTTTGTGLHQFNYVGSWSSGSQSGAFFNDNHWSSTSNASCTVQFTGTRVDLYGARASSHGLAAVSIDDGPETLVDYYASSRADKALLWSAAGLVSGTHTLKVRVTGARNASSSGNTITLDRVDVWTTASPLSGTIIGTAGSFGGSGNTKEKALDGNLNTYFDAPLADGAWVGLDFGATPRRITKISYCPRAGYAARMNGGKFQGANAADFSDAVDLFTISADPFEETLNDQSVSLTNGFRYVRYLAPNASYGNVADIEFYGAEAGAANGTWTADADGNWSDASKWSGGAVASGAGFTADFTLNTSANRTVTLDSSRTIGTLRFGSASGRTWTLESGGGSTLTLETITGTPVILVTNTATAVIATPLAGGNGFTKSGPGTLVLATNNSLSGALNLDRGIDGNNDDGATRIAHPDALLNIDSVNIRNTSVSTAGGATLQLDGSAGNIVVTQSGTFSCRNNATRPTIENVAGSNTLAGTLYLVTGGTNINILCDAGLLTISGTNRYVGNLTGGRTYAFFGPGDFVVSGPILNSTNGAPIALTKSGGGTLRLDGTNTYGNGTTVNGGTLLVNGSITGTVTVASGATLGGAGLIRGPVTVQSGGILTPGDGVGTLTISNLTLTAGAVLQYQLGAASDLTVVSSNLTVAGTLHVADAGGFGAGTYTLFTYGRTLTYNGLSIGAAPAGFNYTVDTGTVGQVRLIVSPALTAWESWQMQYFGSTNCPACGGDADFDGDGMNNANEFLAGTNPTNSASAFRITSLEVLGNDLVVTWEGGAGSTGVVQAASGEYSTNFTDVSGNMVVPVSGTTNFLDGGAATNAAGRFYRVRLVP
jgi:autotransporter-associated beta strand protein